MCTTIACNTICLSKYSTKKILRRAPGSSPSPWNAQNRPEMNPEEKKHEYKSKIKDLILSYCEIQYGNVEAYAQRPFMCGVCKPAVTSTPCIMCVTARQLYACGYVVVQ